MTGSLVVLLGAQRFRPTLAARVDSLGVRGKVATVTAGWQEREGEDAELDQHLGGRTVNLKLHARGEQLFREDPEFAALLRERQDTLRAMQELYRIRLDHALDAERAVARAHVPESLREEARQASVAAIRDLDAWHLLQCVRVLEEFDARVRPAERPSVRKHRAEVAERARDCEAVAVAGGHVAMLVNRLALFGFEDLARGRPVFAWSGGAMALSDRIVLFHDSPPQGAGLCEVLRHGLGLAPGVVVLPEPEQRLRFDLVDRVALLAARFAPATCVALPATASVVSAGGRLQDPDGALVLTEAGGHAPLPA